MSLADEVLATHRPEPDSQAEYDNCSGCAGTWPCESVRLALSLQAAEQVVEVAMCLKHSINGEHGRGGPLWAEPCPEASLSEEVKCRYARAALLGVPVERLIPRVLAEYDKEGQG